MKDMLSTVLFVIPKAHLFDRYPTYIIGPSQATVLIKAVGIMQLKSFKVYS